MLCVWRIVNSAESVFLLAPQDFLEKKHSYGVMVGGWALAGFRLGICLAHQIIIN